MVKECKIISKNSLNMVVKYDNISVQIPTVETKSDTVFIDKVNGKYIVSDSKMLKKESKKETKIKPSKKVEIKEEVKTEVEENLVEENDKVVDL